MNLVNALIETRRQLDLTPHARHAGAMRRRSGGGTDGGTTHQRSARRRHGSASERRQHGRLPSRSRASRSPPRAGSDRAVARDLTPPARGAAVMTPSWPRSSSWCAWNAAAAFDEELRSRRVRADIHLVGGAAMLLAYGERPATRDRDGTWGRRPAHLDTRSKNTRDAATGPAVRSAYETGPRTVLPSTRTQRRVGGRQRRRTEQALQPGLWDVESVVGDQ